MNPTERIYLCQSCAGEYWHKGRIYVFENCAKCGKWPNEESVRQFVLIETGMYFGGRSSIIPPDLTTKELLSISLKKLYPVNLQGIAESSDSGQAVSGTKLGRLTPIRRQTPASCQTSTDKGRRRRKKTSA